VTQNSVGKGDLLAISMPVKRVPDRRSGLRPSANFQNGVPVRSATKISLPRVPIITCVTEIHISNQRTCLHVFVEVLPIFRPVRIYRAGLVN
jgi:hypothetical protein